MRLTREQRSRYSSPKESCASPSRFQANDVDRKNRLTDGRLAVARMVGFGDYSRAAHLGLIELANSWCRPVEPGVPRVSATKRTAQRAAGTGVTPTLFDSDLEAESLRRSSAQSCAVRPRSS